MDVPSYRTKQLKNLTNWIGVYALLDLDGTPIYVGQSIDGIATRVRRHLTSARSDIIANRALDIWEVSMVRAWPVMKKTIKPEGQTKKEFEAGLKAVVDPIEATLFYEFENTSPLMNGKPPLRPEPGVTLPKHEDCQVLPDEEIAARAAPRQRFPRQVQMIGSLLDYILEVKDEPHLRRSLRAHYKRLATYYEDFQDGRFD